MLDILRLLLKYGPLLRLLVDVLELPDFSKKEEVRAWLRLVVDLSNELSELTPTLIDDKIVDALSKIMENDEVWSVVWMLINSFLDNNDFVARHPSSSPIRQDEVRAVATELDIDPNLVIQIIMLIVELIQKLWRTTK